ncbi:uncharacterized protein LOC143461224 [Clavelina lepadiformis]|uniref:uncharacterized protein LOC143461224 n=1 Tax=Clavelina lepadiformis TaxID=159417 RepID=UPI00404266EA
MAQVAHVLAVLLALAGISLSSVAFALVDWLTVQKQDGSTNKIGLWVDCSTTPCTNIEWSVLHIAIGRGLMIGGIFFFSLGLFLGFSVLFCCDSSKACCKGTVSSLYITAGILVAAGGGVFYGYSSLSSLLQDSISSIVATDTVTPGLSVYLALGGASALFVSGIFYSVSACCESSPAQVAPKTNAVTATTIVAQPGVYIPNQLPGQKVQYHQQLV